ncbi:MULTISPECIES: daptide-type RiPP [unclassified Streptomyces]|uniref:daptide-type RiPP n=1 Tax=unclassified Streptomyces TaxID=2593676 RepID=UPI0004BF2F82|nr:daptide-type RiPP [Streptomyces sp. NRRL S-87]
MSEKNVGHRAETAVAAPEQDLELGLQELEALEAPGWITIGGISAGGAVSAAVSAAVIIT